MTEPRSRTAGSSPSTDPRQDDPEQNGVGLIAAERKRQVEAEGWTPEHDDGHHGGDLAFAAAHYALTPSHRYWVDWPWPEPPKAHDAAYGPDRIRDLVKAGALIAAEIDRLIRKEARS